MQTVKRLLFVRLRSLGDTVLMTPALAAAKRMPGWKVAVVVEEPFDDVLRGNPNLDQLFVIPKRPSKPMARFRTLRQIRRSFWPDTVVDLHGGTTSALMAFLSGASERIGYAGARHAYLYNLKVPPSREVWGRNEIHTVEHQLSPLKHVGVPVEPIPPLCVPIDPECLERVGGLLEKQRIDPGFVLIHPAAAFETKRWEAGKFAALASRLGEEGRKVVVTVGPGQESLLQEIGSQCSPAVHFLPPFSIREFAALASLCGLYVGNDTGTTHVAAAMGKKIVVIWGSSDFKVWHPWKVEHHLLKSDLPCIPCPGYYCLYYDEPRCIRSIEVESVLRAAKSFL